MVGAVVQVARVGSTDEQPLRLGLAVQSAIVGGGGTAGGLRFEVVVTPVPLGGYEAPIVIVLPALRVIVPLEAVSWALMIRSSPVLPATQFGPPALSVMEPVELLTGALIVRGLWAVSAIFPTAETVPTTVNAPQLAMSIVPMGVVEPGAVAVTASASGVAAEWPSIQMPPDVACAVTVGVMILTGAPEAPMLPLAAS